MSLILKECDNKLLYNFAIEFIKDQEKNKKEDYIMDERKKLDIERKELELVRKDLAIRREHLNQEYEILEKRKKLLDEQFENLFIQNTKGKNLRLYT